MSGPESAARLLAKKWGTSVAIVDSYDIRHDPEDAFAIVPMRVVGEEVTQAVGYGLISSPPTVVVEHHALSRRTAFLDPFAQALDAYLACARHGELPRIYIPNAAALELLTVMATRYEIAGKNPNPNPALRPSVHVTRLGYLLRLLKDIYHMPGQQVVIVMTETIQRHFVTGQMPPKDGHLGALTEWLAAARASTDTQLRADRRALAIPAAAMLPRDGDDEIEKLLRQLRKVPAPQKQPIIDRIEAIQEAAVRSDWEMLQEAHAAFWGRNLAPTSQMTVADHNIRWLGFRLGTNVQRSRRAIALSKRYEAHEFLASAHKNELIANDTMRFEHERADGRAFVGTIATIRRAVRNVSPSQLDLAVDHQPNIRLRLGQRIQTVGNDIVGEVQSVTRTGTGYDVVLTIISGVKKAVGGARHRWAAPLVKEHIYRRGSDPHENIKRILGMP